MKIRLTLNDAGIIDLEAVLELVAILDWFVMAAHAGIVAQRLIDVL